VTVACSRPTCAAASAGGAVLPRPERQHAHDRRDLGATGDALLPGDADPGRSSAWNGSATPPAMTPELLILARSPRPRGACAPGPGPSGWRQRPVRRRRSASRARRPADRRGEPRRRSDPRRGPGAAGTADCRGGIAPRARAMTSGFYEETGAAGPCRAWRRSAIRLDETRRGRLPRHLEAVSPSWGCPSDWRGARACTSPAGPRQARGGVAGLAGSPARVGGSLAPLHAGTGRADCRAPPAHRYPVAEPGRDRASRTRPGLAALLLRLRGPGSGRSRSTGATAHGPGGRPRTPVRRRRRRPPWRTSRGGGCFCGRTPPPPAGG